MIRRTLTCTSTASCFPYTTLVRSPDAWARTQVREVADRLHPHRGRTAGQIAEEYLLHVDDLDAARRTPRRDDAFGRRAPHRGKGVFARHGDRKSTRLNSSH